MLYITVKPALDVLKKKYFSVWNTSYHIKNRVGKIDDHKFNICFSDRIAIKTAMFFLFCPRYDQKIKIKIFKKNWDIAVFTGMFYI